ncbi:helix-turn-helix domain-containing protein [Paenibacillus prosopidis]|uniref:Helix-turn-helix protein n=1 Tax=Paenibacillus prosopidis TaxID=630520 RepID=A0A368W624_9BACL|nr:helix-turn-helix domain-containing protein [Paenibacillus prosopidis]RCW50878.1 helix-turn-helix protein [Paenibacillus prosopidis]
MTKGRSTDWKERIDIVLYCLSQNRNYQATSEKYQVSYQQVYQWLRSIKLAVKMLYKMVEGSMKLSGLERRMLS